MKYQGFGYKIFIGDLSAFLVDPALDGRRRYVAGVMLALWGASLPLDADKELSDGYNVGIKMYQYGNGKRAKSEQMAFNTRRKFKRKQATAQLLARGPKICAQCNSDKNIQIDHIVPVTKGGTNDPSNLQFLCRRCNIKKGNH